MAATALAGGVAAAVVLGFAGSAGAAQVKEKSLGLVGPSGKVEAQLPLGSVGEAHLGEGYLWFGSSDDKTVERIDVRTHKHVGHLIPIQDGIAGMAVGLGGVWVVDGNKPLLLRIDPRYITIQRVRLPSSRARSTTQRRRRLPWEPARSG